MSLKTMTAKVGEFWDSIGIFKPVKAFISMFNPGSILLVGKIKFHKMNKMLYNVLYIVQLQ